MNKLLWIALSIGLSTQLLSATTSLPLVSGKAIDGFVKQKNKQYYNITIPKNKSIRVNLTELEADVDLYVKKGNKVRVRFNDCYSANSNRENEECIITNEGETSIYTILVNGFRESSYTLKATIEEAEKIPTLTNDAIKDEVAHKEGKQYRLAGKKGETITITLSDLTADADLRVKVGRKAGLHSFDCKSNNGATKTEECVITPKKNAMVYVHVYGYKAASYSLKAVKETSNPCITREELNNKLLHHENVTDVNTSCITDMSRLSYYMNWGFNQDLSNWDVSNVTNMEEMFAGGKDIGRDGRGIEIDSVGDLSKWDVSKVTNMEAMFYGYYTDISSLRISNWDTSNVTNMKKMFLLSVDIKELDLVDISHWNVKNVTSHENFFSNVINNKQPKWRYKNETNSKLISLAKEHCLNKSNSSKNVLCSNKENIVYIIKNNDLEYTIVHHIYKINIKKNNEKVSLIHKSEINTMDAYFDNKQLEYTPIFMIAYRTIPEEYSMNYVLFSPSGKELFRFYHSEEPESAYSIYLTTDNGKKLIIDSFPMDDLNIEKPIRRIYDISNPNEAKLISQENI